MQRSEPVVADRKKLLVAIDGSNNSLRALAYVVKRVKVERRLRICLLNVQPALPSSLFVTGAMIAEHHESMSDEALARARRVLEKHHVAAEIVVRIGEPAETIVNFATGKHCGEIVMGTRGLGTLKGLLLGSITTKVIHLARVPVTVVP
jgi:nucleotide-binding universal stress UspA family protein